MKTSDFKFQIFLLCLVFILCIRFFFFYSNQPQYVNNKQIVFETTILSQPQISGSRQIVYANLDSGKRISLVLPISPELIYGNRIRVWGNIKVVNLDKVSSKANRLIMYFPKIKLLENDKALAVASVIRQKLVALFLRTLPSPSSSLLLGMVFGIKETMPKSFIDDLRVSGVMHVIAASGMNVTLLGGFVSSFFAFFLNRRVAFGLSILTIIFYVFLAGFEPSIIRAALMGILVFSSQIFGRQSLAIYSLFLAGFVMLLFLPFLIFDIGFQLSFAATAGLLYIRPLFEQNLKLKKIIKKSVIGSEIITTVSAQVATLPILLANFGIYSIWSVLVNGLVLWTVPILMAIGAIGALVGLIFQPLGSLVLYFSYPLLFYFEKIVDVFSGMGGVVVVQKVSWAFGVGYYMMLISLILILKRKFLR